MNVCVHRTALYESEEGFAEDDSSGLEGRRHDTDNLISWYTGHKRQKLFSVSQRELTEQSS